MRALQTRLQRLESRYGTTAPLPWETPGWEQFSDAEMLHEMEQYAAACPNSRLARDLRALETLSDSELEALPAEVQAQLRAAR